MARTKVEQPTEYVLSEMHMRERDAMAHGAIVSPRFEGDDDTRFEGDNGNLLVTIASSHSTRIAAYEHAIEYFKDLRQQELLKDKLLNTGTARKRKRGARR